MTNRRPKWIWIICWKFVSPLLIVVALIFSIRSLVTKTPTYEVWNAEKVIRSIDIGYRF